MEETETILQADELQPAVELTANAMEQLDRLLLGRTRLHRLVLIGVLSRGHLLLEGLPGLGKTALIKALGDILSLRFSRIQFTPDLMPGDIVGTHILQQRPDGPREMTFQPGPVFTNILLADEINRASPKTQSALLEAMQEHSVTLLGETRPLPEPFLVLASQNPIELEGTYPLPEAQLDRFLLKLKVDNVDVGVLEEIIATRHRGEPPAVTWSMSAERLAGLFAIMDRIYLPRPVSRYISRLVAATHAGATEAPPSVTQYVAYGASPRAAISIAESARASALLCARPTVGFEDVRLVAAAAMNHRIILNYKAKFDQTTPFAIVGDILDSLSETGLEMPKDVELARRGGES